MTPAQDILFGRAIQNGEFQEPEPEMMPDADVRQDELFSCEFIEFREPKNHPLRTFLTPVNEGLMALTENAVSGPESVGNR